MQLLEGAGRDAYNEGAFNSNVVVRRFRIEFIE